MKSKNNDKITYELKKRRLLTAISKSKFSFKFENTSFVFPNAFSSLI